MAYDIEQTAYAESAWTRVSYSTNRRTKQRELQRSCKISVDSTEATSLEYLATCISGGNGDVALPYIDNPQASQKTYPGRWRLAAVSWDRQSQEYTETLRYGWATSVLTGNPALPNDECMIAQASDQRADMRVITLLWRNIAEESVKSCMDAIRAAGSFVNPWIQGVQHDATLVVDTITPQQTDDGSYAITVTCIRCASITKIEDFATLVPIRADVRDIENPFGVEGAYTDHNGRKPREGITLTYRALTLASRDVIRALTDKSLLNLLPTADKAKYEMRHRELAEDQGNTLKLVVTYEYIPLKTSTPEDDARLIGEVRFNQSGKLSLTRSWPRIDPSVISDLLVTNVNTNVLAEVVTNPKADGKTYAGDWLVLRTSKDMTADDGQRIVQELIKAGDQKLFTKTGTDPDHLVCEFQLWDAGVVAIEAFLADTDPFKDGSVNPRWSTPEVGITKAVQKDANGDRSINLRALYATTAGLNRIELSPVGFVVDGVTYAGGTPLTIRERKHLTSEYGYGWNVPVTALASVAAYYNPAATGGDPDPWTNRRREFKISRRDAHTFDFVGVVSTITKQEVAEYVASDTPYELVQVKKGRDLTDAEVSYGYKAPPIQVVGEVVEVDIEPAPDGGKNATVKTVTERSVKSTDYEKAPGQTVVVATDTAAAAALGDPGTPTDGVVLTAKSRKTKGGKFVNESTTKTVANLTATEADNTPLKTVTRTKHTNLAQTADAAAVNTASRVNNERDPVTGATRSAKETTTATPWTHPASGSFTVVSNLGGVFTESVRKFRNQTAIPSASAGEIVKALENELASFDGEIVQRSITSNALAGFVTVASSAYEWKERQGQYRIPKWTTSTDSTVPQRITGYTVVDYIIYYTRLVEISVTRRYFSSHPTLTNTPASVAGYHKGGGVHHTKQVIELGQGLFASDERTLTISDWVKDGSEIVTVADT